MILIGMIAVCIGVPLLKIAFGLASLLLGKAVAGSVFFGG